MIVCAKSSFLLILTLFKSCEVCGTSRSCGCLKRNKIRFCTAHSAPEPVVAIYQSHSIQWRYAHRNEFMKTDVTWRHHLHTITRHFSVSFYLLARSITPVPSILSCQRSQLHFFLLSKIEILQAYFHGRPHTRTHKECTCTHAQHQIHIPLGHAFCCSPDCDKLV